MSLKFCAHAKTQAYVLYRTMASGSGGGRWSGRWTDDPRKMAASHWGREDRTDRIWQKVYAAEEREHNTKNDLMKSQMALEAALITFPMHFSHVVLMKYLSQATKVLLSEANTALDEAKKVRQELETALDAVTQAKDKAAIENKAALDAANKEIEKRGGKHCCPETRLLRPGPDLEVERRATPASQGRHSSDGEAEGGPRGADQGRESKTE